MVNETVVRGKEFTAEKLGGVGGWGGEGGEGEGRRR